MAGVNQVTLVGNLGADPESRSFQNGGRVVNLRVATSETWKDKHSGERQEKTEWHTVAIFSEGLGDVAMDYLRKGSKVFLQGKLETRKWQDQQGGDRYSTEIVLRGYDAKLVMLDGAQGGGGNGGGRDRDDGWGDSGRGRAGGNGGRGGGNNRSRDDRGGGYGSGRGGGREDNRGTRNDRGGGGGRDDGGWGNRNRDDRGGGGGGQGDFGGGFGDDLDDDVPF